MQIVTGLAVASAYQSTRRTRSLRAQLSASPTSWAIDRRTGLLCSDAFVERMRGERSRASRFGVTMHLWLVLVREGDADDFGRRAAGELAFPVFGARLNNEGLFCFASPSEQCAAVRQFLSDTNGIFVGEASCGDALTDAAALIQLAEQDMLRTATPHDTGVAA